MNKYFKLAGLLVASVLAQAEVGATSLNYLSNTTGGFTSGWSATAQTFTAGANETLLSYSFVGAQGSQSTYTFNLYDWSTSGNHSALYSTTQAWVGGINTINSINVALQAGHTYAAEVDYLGVTSGGVQFGGDVYVGGNGFWASNGVTNGNSANYTSFSGLDTAFALNVSAVPEPETYAMLLAGLGVMGAVARRRKAKQA